MAKIKIAVMTDIVDLFTGLSSGRNAVKQEISQRKTTRVLIRKAIAKEWEDDEGDLDYWSLSQIFDAFDALDNDEFVALVEPNMDAAVFDDIGTVSVPKYVSFIVPIEFDTRAFMLSRDKKRSA